jgi:hypothetical protein
LHRKRGNLKIGLLVAVVLVALPHGAPATPPYFQKLIDAGNVEFEFCDPRQDRHSHLGHTQFRLDVHHDGTFEHRWEVNHNKHNLVIAPKIGNITYRLTNRVRLPNRFASDSDWRWSHFLMKHEFDHVAMSTDPRVRMLIEHLYGGIRRIDRALPLDAKIDERLVLQIIDEEVAPRRSAVIQALLANQKLLDDATDHGTRPLPDREQFFRSLFTAVNLREAGFPYVSEVSDLFQTETYQNVVLPYDLEE